MKRILIAWLPVVVVVVYGVATSVDTSRSDDSAAKVDGTLFAIDGERALVAEGGGLSCIDRTGARLWHFQLSDDAVWIDEEYLRILGDVVVFRWRTPDRHVLGKTTGTFEVRALRDGSLRWRQPQLGRSSTSELDISSEYLVELVNVAAVRDGIFRVERARAFSIETGALVWQRGPLMGRRFFLRDNALVIWDWSKSRIFELEHDREVTVDHTSICPYDRGFIREHKDADGEPVLIHHARGTWAGRASYRIFEGERMHSCARYGDQIVVMIVRDEASDLVFLGADGRLRKRISNVGFTHALDVDDQPLNRFILTSVGIFDLETGDALEDRPLRPKAFRKGRWTLFQNTFEIMTIDGDTGKVATSALFRTKLAPQMIGGDRLWFVDDAGDLKTLDLATLRP